MKIYDLPIEIWRLIFAHLSVRDAIHMVVASKYFQGAVNMAQIEEAKAKFFCEGCNMVTSTGVYADHKCVDCYDGDTCITLARARSVFRMKLVEVSRLPCQKPKRSRYGSLKPESLYRFKIVRDAALQKYGKRMNEVVRDLKAEERRKQAAQEAMEAKRAKKLRSGLEKLGVQYSDTCALLAEEYLTTGKDYKGTLAHVQESVRATQERAARDAVATQERAARAAVFNARLDALGMDKTYYSGLRKNYVKNWAGYRNLDRLVQIMADTLEIERSDAAPQQKLARAMGLRGIQVRADSKLCEQYVSGRSQLPLPSIVEIMFVMHVLHQHTGYSSYCDVAYQILRHCRVPIAENMPEVREELETRSLAALGTMSDEEAHRAPLCSCGFSKQRFSTPDAMEYMDDLDDNGPPSWMYM